jgi:hypothetical protein
MVMWEKKRGVERVAVFPNVGFAENNGERGVTVWGLLLNVPRINYDVE